MGFFLFTDCFCLHSVILTLEKITLSHVTVCCILDTMRHNSSHKVTQNNALHSSIFFFISYILSCILSLFHFFCLSSWTFSSIDFLKYFLLYFLLLQIIHFIDITSFLKGLSLLS